MRNKIFHLIYPINLKHIIYCNLLHQEIFKSKVNNIKPNNQLDCQQQNKIQTKTNKMFLSNKLATGTLYSARLSNFSNEKFTLDRSRNLSQSRGFSNKKDQQKIQFRKVILSRNKHNRIPDDQQRKMRNATETRVRQGNRVRTCQNQAEIVQKKKEENNQEMYESQVSSRRQLPTKESRQFVFRKDSSKDHGTKVGRNNKDIQITVTNLQPSPQQQLPRITSSMQKNTVSNFSFLEIPKTTAPTNQNPKPKHQPKSHNSSRLQNHSRPLSSASSTSSLKLYKKDGNSSRLQNNQLTNEEKQLFESEKSNKRQKDYSLEEIEELFQFTENRINVLIEKKWQLIQQKLTGQKYSRNRNNKGNFDNQRNQELIENKITAKFPFSQAVQQKQIDTEIMTLIRNLRYIDLTKIAFDLYPQVQKPSKDQIVEELQKRRSQIIERALAQSMVQAEMLRKYYSGQNANSLKTSNYKVGQLDKVKLTKNPKTPAQGFIDPKQKESLERSSNPKPSVSNDTQTTQSYKPPQLESYQKYRYQQPIFKPNLQPLPRSAYKSEFFSYGNFKNFYPQIKQEENMIFPKTSTLKKSYYKSEFRQKSSQRVDFRQLDAFRDKFRQLDITFMPNNRSTLSEANTARKKPLPKFINQLQYVKKLKTQSMLDTSKQLTKKRFITQTRQQYQNPQTYHENYAKSQIKHKNLYQLKYSMKRKFQV